MRKMIILFIVIGILIGALPALDVCEYSFSIEHADLSEDVIQGDNFEDPAPCGEGGGGSGGGGQPG